MGAGMRMGAAMPIGSSPVLGGRSSHNLPGAQYATRARQGSAIGIRCVSGGREGPPLSAALGALLCKKAARDSYPETLPPSSRENAAQSVPAAGWARTRPVLKWTQEVAQ